MSPRRGVCHRDAEEEPVPGEGGGSPTASDGATRTPRGAEPPHACLSHSTVLSLPPCSALLFHGRGVSGFHSISLQGWEEDPEVGRLQPPGQPSPASSRGEEGRPFPPEDWALHRERDGLFGKPRHWHRFERWHMDITAPAWKMSCFPGMSYPPSSTSSTCRLVSFHQELDPFGERFHLLPSHYLSSCTRLELWLLSRVLVA